MLNKADYDLLNSVNFDLLNIVKSIRKYVTIKYFKPFNFKKDKIQDLFYCFGEPITVCYCCRGDNDNLIHSAIELYLYLYERYYKAVIIANKIINNNNAKKTRLRKFIDNEIFSTGKALFLTHTFRDSVLKSTSVKTRRVYIQRFLSQFNVPAVANIDFGSKKHREHYHSIIAIDKVNPQLYRYGNLDIVRITINENSLKKTSTYLTKLTYHALKQSTRKAFKNNSLIYIHKK